MPHDHQTIATRPLPLVPEALLKKLHVHEPLDHRFKACARFLQSLWREEQGLPMGHYSSPNTAERPLGSRLAPDAAATGRNFMTPAIAKQAANAVVYQERGAFIEQGRLRQNLLSSMPLAFNLFGPMAEDYGLASKVLRSLIPCLDLRRVLNVRFEHSPDRNHPDFTGDQSAFDVAVVYERSDREICFMGIEVKYSETGRESGSLETSNCLGSLAERSGLYHNANDPVLRTAPYQQLFREHLLTFVAKDVLEYADAHFVLVSPNHNHLVQQAADLYAAKLVDPDDLSVPFHQVALERIIEAFGWAGALDYALALHDRYCDWTKIDRLIEAEVDAAVPDWSLSRPRIGKVSGLIAVAG